MPGLSVARSVYRKYRESRLWLVCVFVALQILDVATTKLALILGGVEMNPFLAPLIAGFGVSSVSGAKVLGILFVGTFATVHHRKTKNLRSKGVWGILPIVNAVFAGICLWNLQIVIRLWLAN